MSARPGSDELLVRLLEGDRTLTRNKNFELFASLDGRRARRRAGFLRSIARELAREVDPRARVRLEERPARLHDASAGDDRRFVVSIERIGVRRRAYLSGAELDLIARAFPRAAVSIEALRSAREAD